MALVLHNNSKAGYYDSVSGKVHTGTRMQMGENIGTARYYNDFRPFINLVKGSRHLNIPSAAEAARLGTNDYINDGSSWNLLVLGPKDGVPSWCKEGTYVLKWTGTADINFTGASGTSNTATVDAGTDIVTCAQAEFFDDVVVRFSTSGTLPAGLSAGTDYHVINTTGNDFQVSLTEGGDPVNITDTGSGTHYIAWAEETSSAANRKEYLIYGNVVNNNANLNIGAGTCSALAFIQPGEEANHDAGKLYAAQFISDMSGVHCLRPMGMQGTNDGNAFRDIADFYDFDDVNWYYGIPPRAIALMAEECDCDVWACIPHQATDAAVTWFAGQLNTYMPVGKKVKIEYSNETWNTATGFKDQSSWITSGDVAPVDATIVPATAVVTSTGHGLSTGDLLTFFITRNMLYRATSGQRWPYADGGKSYIVVDDANTFRVCAYYNAAAGSRRDITGATQANPCVITSIAHGFSNGDVIHIYSVTGMTELNGNDYTVANVTADTFELSGVDSSAFTAYTSGGYILRPDVNVYADLDEIRYKNSADSVKDNDENHSDRSAEIWTLCKAVLGDKMEAVLAGQRTNAGVLESRLAVPAARDLVDFVSVASYYRFNNWTDPYYSDTPATGRTHTGTSSATVLTDSTKTGQYAWTVNEFVGKILVNDTDRCYGTVTSNTENTITCSGGLTGGTNNTFETGDAYRVSHYATATTAEITAYLKAVNGPEVLQQQIDNTIKSGTYNLVNYEGGDHTGGPGYDGGTKIAIESDKMIEWARSDDAADFVNWWGKALADAGVKLFVHHAYCGKFSESNIFSRMEHPGDTDSPKHAGMIEFYTNGGAPKN